MSWTIKDIEAMKKSGRIRDFASIPVNDKRAPQKVPVTETGPKVSFKRLIIEFCREHGLVLLQEQRFHVERKWRFDYLVTGAGGRIIALEYDGIFSKDANRNGHQSQPAYMKDVEKLNAATLAGIPFLRYTAKDYTKVGEDLKNIFYDKI